MYDFGCDHCGSPAVVYPPALEENLPVVCARCSKEICSYGELRKKIARSIRSDRERPK